MKIEIFSDLACPWCYVGKRRFESALADFPGREGVDVHFRPYQLDPGAPVDATPLRAHLEQRYGSAADAMMARVSGAAVAEGIAMDWDRALAANTRTAHRLLRLAVREYGSEVQGTLMAGLFAAHFERGGDLADPVLLAGLAVSAGMERERVEAYLASGEGEEELAAELEEARALGVRSVPTFVFDDRWVLEGAQPVATFLQALTDLAGRSRPGAPEAEPPR